MTRYLHRPRHGGTKERVVATGIAYFATIVRDFGIDQQLLVLLAATKDPRWHLPRREIYLKGSYIAPPYTLDAQYCLHLNWETVRSQFAVALVGTFGLHVCLCMCSSRSTVSGMLSPISVTSMTGHG
jgi:hypothetical protein